MYVTKFNDNPDFVEIAIFCQQRNLFCPPGQERFLTFLCDGGIITLKMLTGRGGSIGYEKTFCASIG